MISTKILIDLDSIFDTYLGCAEKNNPLWLKVLLQNGYIHRMHNTLSLINHEIDDDKVLDTYLNRDASILRISKASNMLNVFTNSVAISNGFEVGHPEHVDYTFTINTYPYELTNAELRELFKQLQYILGVSKITRVHMPISELTPLYLKDRFTDFVIYDFSEWCKHNRLLLNNTKLPNVNCITPFILRPGMETACALDELDKISDVLRTGLRFHLKVDFLPLSEFSVRGGLNPDD